MKVNYSEIKRQITRNQIIVKNKIYNQIRIKLKFKKIKCQVKIKK